MMIHSQTALTSTGHYQAEFNGQPIKDQKQDGDKQKNIQSVISFVMQWLHQPSQ